MANINRNDPCTCGSGKKYKHCCINLSAPKPQQVAPMTVAQKVKMAQQLCHMRRFDDALLMVKALVKASPQNAEMVQFLGTIQLELGQGALAVSSLQKATKLAPGEAQNWFALGTAYCRLGQFDLAVAPLREAIKRQPRMAEAQVNLGQVLSLNGQKNEAVAAYKAAIDVKPDFGLAWSGLGDVLRDLEQFDEAAHAYRQAMQSTPGSVPLHCNLGLALERQGLVAEALASYRKAKELQPDSMFALSNELFAERFLQDSSGSSLAKTPYSQLFRDSLLLLSNKRAMLEKESDDIDTIAIGSSHGDFGFDPSQFPKSFNLCCRSQDLKHSYYLHERISEKYKHIKNVIVFYSLFSPGSFMEKSPSECEIAPVLNEVFDLKIKYEDEKLNALSGSLHGKLDGLSVGLDGVRGFLPKFGKNFLSADAKTRVHSHSKYNKVVDANVFLGKILQLARELNQRVCIVIPPARSDYRAAAGGDSAMLLQSLSEVMANGLSDGDVMVLDCFGDAQFSDDLFGDTDHLLPLGAGPRLLAKRIYEVLSSRQSGALAS